MNDEYVLEALKDIAKKIAGLKEFHAAVILQTIEDYEREGVDILFIEQQKAQLKKVYQQIDDLEARGKRLMERL